MKRVGIITFHRALNYGAVLQTYALQKVMQNLNTECEIIDYRKNKIELDYSLLPLSKYKGVSFPQKIKKFLKSILLLHPVKAKRYRLFLKNHLKLSKESYDRKTISKAGNRYDIYITGSDQVWNDDCTGFDTAYFLDFVRDNHKKYSYAASFGFEAIPKELKPKYKKLLAKFEDISVREKSGCNIVRELLGREAKLSLDPTLLLEKKDWEQIAIRPTMKRYILVYCLVKSERIVCFAEQLSKIMDLPVFYIYASMKNAFKKNGILNAGPREFLGYFLNAEYIITNSFHGLIYSVNLNKKLFVEQRRSNGKIDTRLANTVHLFHLEDRDIEAATSGSLLKEIDYHEINKILKIEREHSLDYLQRMIE